MKRLPTNTVKERSRKLTKLFESYQTYDHLLHSKQKVWITEYASDNLNLVGHTKNYVQVLISPDEAKIGTSTFVKIVKIGKHFVNGVVIDKEEFEKYFNENQKNINENENQKNNNENENNKIEKSEEKSNEKKDNIFMKLILFGIIPLILILLLFTLKK
jgi:ATP-dependent Zn protease